MRKAGLLVLLVAICIGCNSGANPPALEVSEARERVFNEMQQAAAVEEAGGEVLNVGFVILDAVYNSELMAPYDVIQHTIFRDDQNASNAESTKFFE